jgi:hypothetical protein
MATVATLVGQGKNHLRYLITNTDATAVTITTTGAVSPDLLTDTLQGPLKKMAKAFTDGYGTLGSGVKTQAQARAIWQDDDTGSNIGNTNIQRAQCYVTERSGTTEWIVDANVDGGGHPTLVVTPTAAAGSCYLDVEVPGAIGA